MERRTFGGRPGRFKNTFFRLFSNTEIFQEEYLPSTNIGLYLFVCKRYFSCLIIFFSFCIDLYDCGRRREKNFFSVLLEKCASWSFSVPNRLEKKEKKIPLCLILGKWQRERNRYFVRHTPAASLTVPHLTLVVLLKSLTFSTAVSRDFESVICFRVEMKIHISSTLRCLSLCPKKAGLCS